MDSVPDNDGARDTIGSGHDREGDKIGSGMTDEALDEMIDAMEAMQNPDESEGKTFDELIEVYLFVRTSFRSQFSVINGRNFMKFNIRVISKAE